MATGKSESIGVVLSKMAHDLVGDKRRWIIAKIPAQSQTLEVYNTRDDAPAAKFYKEEIEEVVQSRLIGWGRNGRLVHVDLVKFAQDTWIIIDPFFLTYMAKRYPKVPAGDALAKLHKVYKQDHSLGPMLEFPSKVYKWLHVLECTIPFPCVLCGKFPARACKGCIRVHYCGPKCQKQHWRHTHKQECHGVEIAGFKAGFKVGIEKFLEVHELVLPEGHDIACIQRSLGECL
jgi:hypothetical protein